MSPIRIKSHKENIPEGAIKRSSAGARDLSFGTKILLYGSGASLFSLVLAMAAILLFDYAEFRNAFVNKISDRAEILSRSCASALVFKDPASAAKALTDLAGQQDVTAACVSDEKGAVFAKFRQEGLSHAFPSAPSSPTQVFREGRLDVFHHIKFTEEVVGMLYIRANPDELRIRFQRYLRISIAVLLVSFLAAVLLAILLKRTLVRPIQELVDVAETVSKDNNYAVQAKKFANDELGALADAFNQMIQRVQLREEERDDAEAELKESEAKLTALFTSLTEMVVMHELVLNAAGEAIDYRIIDCNKVFTELTGIRKEDAIGKLASQVYQTDPPPYLEIYAKLALGGDPLEFTTYDPPLDKHFMVSVVSPQARQFATITTDITAMMQIQETIMAKNKEMENYLYIASHDLRAPLVNIQGFSQRLKRQADSIKNLLADKRLEPEILHQLANITDENIPTTLNFIYTNTEKMDTLINGLLQLSRTGRVKMNIQKIDMNKLLAKILQSLDFQIKEAQCEIHLDPLPECYGDAALLDQIFANIISNALKYKDAGRALEITVSAKNVHNKVVYTIRDTGKGIALKHLEKIWSVFYRVDPRSDKAGEGIGLSLVKRIAEKHKGIVWAESEENKGSVFHIELPNHSFTEL
jgi:signal transduction histidine kinase